MRVIAIIFIRIVTIIFLGFGLLLLLRRVDLTLHFIPLATPGPEGGLIEIGIDTVFGSGATVLGLVFATINFFGKRSSTVAVALLTWGCLQLLGFAAFYIHDFAA